MKRQSFVAFIIAGIFMLFAGWALFSCSGSAPIPSGTPIAVNTPDPTLVNNIDLAVTAVTTLGCAFIPATDKAAALAALQVAKSVVDTNPAGIIAQLTSAANNPAISWIWYGLHAVLDSLTNITSSQWFQLAQAASASAISGCALGLGVTL